MKDNKIKFRGKKGEGGKVKNPNVAGGVSNASSGKKRKGSRVRVRFRSASPTSVANNAFE